MWVHGIIAKDGGGAKGGRVHRKTEMNKVYQPTSLRVGVGDACLC